MADEKTWLTKEAYDRLHAELKHLETEGRDEIAKRIEEARDEGDLKENSGYHAAKDEQGKIDARIRELTELLRHAEVGEPVKAHGIVELGTVVTAEIAGTPQKFLFGSREISGDTDLKVYSAQSPLGEAINGVKEGQTVSYEAPNGKSVKVKVVKVENYDA